MATLTKTNLKTPLEMLYGWEKSQPEKVYMTQPLGSQYLTWTWGQATEEIRKMAAAIESRGYAPGSRIAILSKNCAHWIRADLTIMMSGHISVPIYPNVNAGTVSYILDHSEAQLLFVGKLDAHDWKEMQKGIPAGLECISFGIYDTLPGMEGYTTWNDTISQHQPMAANPTRDLNEMMTIIYTSGTTGTPKGVVLNFVSPVFAIEAFNDIFSLTKADKFFSYLPMSHIAERMLITMGTLRCGGSVNFAHSLETFKDDLVKGSPTIFLGVPRIWAKFQSGVLAKFSPSKLNLLLSIPILNNVIRKKIREALGLSNARVCLTGAAPMPKAHLEWYKNLGISIYEVYGMTENAAYSHSNLPGQYRFGTVGKPMPNLEMKITEEGEICVKSLANMVEYYREPEKTAETIRDGFLHTGDKGVVDPDGFVRITGRVKDLFKTSKAKYVAPNPIEMLLSKNEYIEQVCVVGSNIPQPIALVVLSEKGRAKDREEIAASIKETLAEVNPQLEHHEKLQNAVVVQGEWTTDNGILTPSLKIKRGAVDDKYEAHYEKWYETGKGVVWE
ncbi:MAG: AMP-binding protein [Bacteroidia bacterium]